MTSKPFAPTMTTVAAMMLIAASAVSAQGATLSVSGAPALMRISNATAGSEPVGLTNVAGGTYTVTTGNANRTYAITAQLNANMPTGTTLFARLDAPPGGAVSLGAVALDITARNLVTGIVKNSNATQNIYYDFAATAAAGVIPLSSRTVTFTVVRFP